MGMHKKMVNGDKIMETNSGGPLSPSWKLMLSSLFSEAFEIVSVGGHCQNPSPISLSDSGPEVDCCDTSVSWWRQELILVFTFSIETVGF
jgi:hypothetical protein